MPPRRRRGRGRGSARRITSGRNRSRGRGRARRWGARSSSSYRRGSGRGLRGWGRRSSMPRTMSHQDHRNLFLPATRGEMTHDDLRHWSSLDWRSVGPLPVPIPRAKPLNDYQIDWLNSSENTSDISDIRFISKEGEGSSSVVWAVQCLERQSGRRQRFICRIRQLKKQSSKTVLECVDRLFSDYAFLNKLNHPNIIQPVECIGIPHPKTGFPFSVVLLFTEFCDENLTFLMERPPNYQIPEQLNKHWFRQIGEAVKYLHETYNAAHLDIKPEHILFQLPQGMSLNKTAIRQMGPNWTFKLTGFMSAVSLTDQQTGSPPVVSNETGTVEFMPPEARRRGRRDVAAKQWDIYSLGVTLAVALLDVASYKDIVKKNRVHEAMGYVLDGQRPKNVSRDVADLISSMTADQLHSRISISEVLQHRWLTGPPPGSENMGIQTDPENPEIGIQSDPNEFWPPLGDMQFDQDTQGADQIGGQPWGGSAAPENEDQEPNFSPPSPPRWPSPPNYPPPTPPKSSSSPPNYPILSLESSPRRPGRDVTARSPPNYPPPSPPPSSAGGPAPQGDYNSSVDADSFVDFSDWLTPSQLEPHSIGAQGGGPAATENEYQEPNFPPPSPPRWPSPPNYPPPPPPESSSSPPNYPPPPPPESSSSSPNFPILSLESSPRRPGRDVTARSPPPNYPPTSPPRSSPGPIPRGDPQEGRGYDKRYAVPGFAEESVKELFPRGFDENE